MPEDSWRQDSDRVREDVLEQVLPEQEERDQNWEMFSRIQEFIEDNYDVEARLMGSTAKNTFISGDKDLDIFVLFPTDYDEDHLEDRGLMIGESVFEYFDGEYEVEYAEHPYTKGEIDGYEIEIVPAYNVDAGTEIRSSVDRTPFHTEWADNNLTEEQKREVVVLKAFLRGQDLYGSTLRVEGFSGYLCELLIAAYGSFEAVIESAVEWDEEQLIDPENHHAAHHDDSENRRSSTRSRGNGALPNYLKQKFEDENLVVIDPVDPERNVASVLSNENHARFVYVAWQYMQQPDEGFFFPEEDAVQEVEIKEELFDRGDFVMVEFPTPDLIEDILYPQLRSLMRRLHQVLKDADFRIFESGFHVGDDTIRILFEFYSAELPCTRKQVGPKPFHNTEHMANFTGKYDRVWVEDTRLVTHVDRDHIEADALLDSFLSGDLQSKGVPKQLAPAVEQCEITDIELDGEDWRRFLRRQFKLGG